jgi:Protein of unknown function (DUF4240)
MTNGRIARGFKGMQSGMDDQQFWTIIEECHSTSRGNVDQKDQLIKAAIRRLSRNETLVFYRIFQRMMDTAFTWPLWGAAYVVNGGCGDDSFTDFRASLISRGRAVFNKAVADPDSLAEDVIDVSNWFHEGFQYAILEEVKKNIGAHPGRVSPLPSSPAGPRWTEATVKKLYPRLIQKLARAD